MRGGPSPSVVKPRPSWTFGAKGPTERGPHVPSRAIDGHRTFSSWAPSWLQVRIISQFVCVFFARCLEVAFLSFPDGFGMDFGRFGEGSGNVLEMFFKNIGFKKTVFSHQKIDKFNGLSYEKSREKT